MLKKINTKTSLLSLAGLCEIYHQLSCMVCELQKVNVLPYQRYEKYQATFNRMRQNVSLMSALGKPTTKTKNQLLMENFEEPR